MPGLAVGVSVGLSKMRRVAPVIVPPEDLPWWRKGSVPAGYVVAVYQPIGAISLSESYLNIAANEYHAVPSVAPALSEYGWVFDGASTGLSTGLTAGQDWSMIARFIDNNDAGSDNLRVIAGAATSATVASRFYLASAYQLASNPGYVYGFGGSATIVRGAKKASGTLGINGANGFNDGVSGETLSASFPGSFGPILIGTATGSGSYWYNGTVCALAIYRGRLTAEQMLAIHTAMMALQPGEVAPPATPPNTVSWSAVSGADGYEIQTRLHQATDWNSYFFGSGVTTVPLSTIGCLPGSTWEVRIAAFAYTDDVDLFPTGRDTSDFSAIQTFAL